MSGLAYGVKPDWTTLDGYFRAFERARPAINLGTFVGAGTARQMFIGNDDRKATPAEIAKMEAIISRAMEEGALGVSTSLEYVPDVFASTDELLAMAKVAARYGGIYATHQRTEGGVINIITRSGRENVERTAPVPRSLLSTPSTTTLCDSIGAVR